MNIKRGHIPIIHDISRGDTTVNAFGLPNLKILLYFVALLYMSLILSGLLLMFQKKAGLTVAYIQTPFRLMTIIPPSVFFILWPLNLSIPQSVVLLLGFSLVFISEIIKIFTLIVWNKWRIS